MPTIHEKRMTARPEGEFVVFLIGMRINKPWKVHKWLPVALAMPRMLKELQADPELGLLHYEQWFGRTIILVQYWKSFEHLEQFAGLKDGEHPPAWAQFNKRVGSSGDVGIWHETYVVRPGQYENIYHNMPQFGLAKAFGFVEAEGRHTTARGRLEGGRG
ncbi:DUF4188 domain-containing protein [Sulfurimonas sp. HSL-1656]|uniref:DUF4188 domain-containing protein n=1 Tax=Thiomicrolovo subterrani TaxID=3131934 RepID=UPI0031FA3BDE